MGCSPARRPSGGETDALTALLRVDSSNPSLALLGAILGLVSVASVGGEGDHFDRIIRSIAMFSFAGTAVAYRRGERVPGSDPFPIITRWSFLGLGFGLAWEGGVLLFGP